MGYDGGIVIVKKKAVEKVKHLLIAYSFSELYENYLYKWGCPEEYGLLDDEKSIGVDIDKNIFDEYFRRKPLKNGESRLISKSVYGDFFKWIEDKIKNTTLYDIAIGKIDDYTVHDYINVYKFLKDSIIDWDNEYVVFRSDW